MSGEKTESPTTKKIRDARKKGQVAKSKEVVSTALIVCLTFMLIGMSDYYLKHISSLILLPERALNLPFTQALNNVLDSLLEELVYLCIPILCVAALVVVISHAAQFGFLFSSESITPDINKINPVEGTKKIFSIKNLMEFIKSMLKVSFLSLLVWITIQGNLASLLNMTHCGMSCIIPVTGLMIKQMMIICSIGFIIISVADYTFEHYQHIKQLRMSKDEVKREHKEMEGSPEIKSKRRQFHQELQNNNMRDNVKRSSVIVANPTHITIGIRYLKGETPLPLVTMKYTEANALLARKMAEEEGIPIVQRIPLARALYKDGFVDQYILGDLIDPIAEVLRWLAELEHANKSN